MNQWLASISWMQALANFVPVFISGTAMFIWLAWYLGRRVERLFVVVSTVDSLQSRVVVIEIDMSAVKADIKAIKREQRDDFSQFRQTIDQFRLTIDQLMLRNAQP